MSSCNLNLFFQKVTKISDFLNSNDYPCQQANLPPIINGAFIFESPNNTISRYQGQNVVLLCLYLKFEQVGKIVWRKNGFNLTSGINDFHELEIKDLKLNDAATYKCYCNSKLIVTIKLKVLSKLLMPLDSIDDNYDSYNFFILSVYSVFTFLVFFYSVSKYLNTLILSTS